jgi:hypothetical protein
VVRLLWLWLWLLVVRLLLLLLLLLLRMNWGLTDRHSVLLLLLHPLLLLQSHLVLGHHEVLHRGRVHRGILLHQKGLLLLLLLCGIPRLTRDKQGRGEGSSNYQNRGFDTDPILENIRRSYLSWRRGACGRSRGWLLLLLLRWLLVLVLLLVRLGGRIGRRDRRMRDRRRTGDPSTPSASGGRRRLGGRGRGRRLGRRRRGRRWRRRGASPQLPDESQDFVELGIGQGREHRVDFLPRCSTSSSSSSRRGRHCGKRGQVRVVRLLLLPVHRNGVIRDQRVVQVNLDDLGFSGVARRLVVDLVARPVRRFSAAGL